MKNNGDMKIKTTSYKSSLKHLNNISKLLEWHDYSIHKLK
jgi:hypothetical protein